MSNSVFAEVWFWLMVAFSVVLPFGIYGVLLAKKAVSRATVLLFGFAMVAIAGFGLILLQSLSAKAKLTPSLADDAVFSSELSLAFYLFPAMFGGIGVNIISHILISRLVGAEQRFIKEHPEA
jgi:hypothetical protein